MKWHMMRTSRFSAPQNGDQVLSVILPKMALRAADDKMTDPVILQQLPRRN
jgi:hypothetical protein